MNKEEREKILAFTKENLDFTNPEGFYRRLEEYLTAQEGDLPPVAKRHVWCWRPKGFLADNTPEHAEERHEYIRELHQVIWKLLGVIGVAWSGDLKDCVVRTLNKKVPHVVDKESFGDGLFAPKPLEKLPVTASWADAEGNYQSRTETHNDNCRCGNSEPQENQ